MKAYPLLAIAALLLTACQKFTTLPRPQLNVGDESPPPLVREPELGLIPEDLAVIVNLDDPQSVQVGEYYQNARGIPSANMIFIHMTTGVTSITSAEFQTIKAQVDAATPAHVQAFALTWATPYKVQCMSITSAFALGFDTKYCNMTGAVCGSTAASPYYNSTVTHPFESLGMRPTMALAGVTFDEVKALIDRGVASDDSWPAASAYLVRSSDSARSVRWTDFLGLDQSWEDNENISIQYLDQSTTGPGYISGREDVLFYLASTASVAEIASNTYFPGAIADHLTSYGGVLTGGGQMSALRWLEAGATGSFGTVVEPCNYTMKFPQASVLIPHYYAGDTLLEAYWKSVAWPGEGIFVGEPLAKPFRRAKP